MAERLGLDARNISKYERDKSEPPIEVLLAYARVANVTLEQFIDDEEDLTLET